MRLRDLGPIPGTLPAGKNNAITDVSGVRVGHTTLIKGDDIRTGVTAILPHSDDLFDEKVPAAVHTINGFGKACGFEQVRELGNIETPILLTSTLNIPRVADACITYMIQSNSKLRTVNPIVGECNDGFLNDIQGRHVAQEQVFAAIQAASDGLVEEGCVGAGTGTLCYQFKGGIGTASRITGDYTLGALLQTNFGRRNELMIMGVPVGNHLPNQKNVAISDGSVMIVLATDAPLTSRQLERLAHRAAFGLGRTGTICHHGSGDYVIAFSTAYRLSNTLIDVPHIPESQLDSLFHAVVESVEEAVYNSLIAATDMQGIYGHFAPALPHDELLHWMRYYKRLG
jgi:D-aminopeptidase